MKKLASLPLFFFLFTLSAYSQEMGFRTTDIGGEFQWYPEGMIYNLHIAFNAKLNHSFQLRVGYNNQPRHDAYNHHVTAKGWGGGIGYRYYFKPFPYQFFIGARADVFNMNVDWDDHPADFAGTFKTWVIHPAFETGYTFIINDQAFITPYIGLGSQSILNPKPTASIYKRGFTPFPGISAGFRL